MMKQPNMTLVALGIYSVAYLMLFLMWGAVYQWGHPGATQDAYISYIHDGLIGLTAHIFTVIGMPSVFGGSDQSQPAQPTAPALTTFTQS
jgi:hypothetical protein